MKNRHHAKLTDIESVSTCEKGTCPIIEPLEQRLLLDGGLLEFGRMAPWGSLVYESKVFDTINSSGEVDRFEFVLEAGQTAAVLLTPSAELLPAVSFLNGDQSLGYSASTASGQICVIQATGVDETLTYAVEVVGLEESVGSYELTVILNATVEPEALGAPANVHPESALDLDDLFTPLAQSEAYLAMVRSAVTTTLVTEDFETGELGEAWSIWSSDEQGRIEIISDSVFEGSFALWMDRAIDDGNYALNEAVWTVDVSSVANPTLAFAHRAWKDNKHLLGEEFVGHFNGDGVSMSNDGVTWQPIWDPSDQRTSRWGFYEVDLVAAAKEAGITLGSEVQIKFQQYDSGQRIVEGLGWDDISIISRDDWYQFTLGHGEQVSVDTEMVSYSNPDIEVYDSAGQLMARRNDGAALNSFGPGAGTYFLRITGDNEYRLAIAKNSVFSRSIAVDITAHGTATGGFKGDYRSFAHTKVVCEAGDIVTIRVLDPITGEMLGAEVDPTIWLYDSQGAALAGNQVEPGQRREGLLIHTVEQAGSYTIAVGEAAEARDYLLVVEGHTGRLPDQTPFKFLAPGDGSLLSETPTQIYMGLADSILLNKLDPSLVTVNSQPAHGVTIKDDRRLWFNYPNGIADGVYTLRVAEGAVTDFHGRPNEAYEGQFTVDTTPPEVIYCSLADGATVPHGDLSVIVQFSEPMYAGSIEGHVYTITDLAGQVYRSEPALYDRETSTLTATFLDLPPEERLELRFNSSDLALHKMETDFHRTFWTDGTSMAFPQPARQILLPDGNSYLKSSETGAIGSAGDLDQYTLDLEVGQTVAVIVHAETSLQPSLKMSLDGNDLAVVSGEQAGKNAYLYARPVTQSGQYILTVSGLSSTVGSYRLEVLQDVALEAEQHTGAPNDSQATAQSLDDEFISLGGTSSRAVVVGSRGFKLTETFDWGWPGPSWTLWSSDTSGRVELRPEDASGETGNSLWMEVERGGLAINEAVWSLDLPDIDRLRLSFSHAEYGDTDTPFDGNFVDHYPADGISFSFDGVTWRPMVTLPSQAYGEWKEYYIDLGNPSGAPLNTIQFKFQHYHSSELSIPSRGWDNIQLIDLDRESEADWYSFTVEDGAVSSLRVFSQGRWDSSLELYDESGTLLTEGIAGQADLSKVIEGAVLEAGTYYARVTGDNDYELVVTREAEEETEWPAFEVSACDPADGSRVAVAPEQITIDFSNQIHLDTLSIDDLTIDGQTPTGMVLVDHDTVVFDVPAPLKQGFHTLAIAGGEIRDIHGTEINPFELTFELDFAPTIIESSVHQGQFLPQSNTIYLQFSEPLLAENLNANDVRLAGLDGEYELTEFSYNPETYTLSLGYSVTREGTYTLTLLSGNGHFEDTVGHDLDGEALAWPIPSNVSGDGVPGGDFVVNFTIDFDAYKLSNGLSPVEPLGSLVHSSSYEGSLFNASDTDQFLLDLEADQTLTVVVESAGDLRPAVEVRFDGIPLEAAEAIAAGEDAYLQCIPLDQAGTYTIDVSGLDGTAGEYEVQLILNAAVQEKTGSTAGNHSLETAQSLDDAFLQVFDSVERTAVLGQGRREVIYEHDFESDDWPGFEYYYPVDYPHSSMITKMSNAGSDSLALWIGYSGNKSGEAVMKVDLSGYSDVELKFSHAEYWDEENSLGTSMFDGHRGGDGISISVDGIQWLPVWNAPNHNSDGNWSGSKINLSLAAAEAGIDLDSDCYIKFQQSGRDNRYSNAKRGWDNLQITGHASSDWYSFTLEKDEIISVTLANLDGTDEGRMIFRDAAGNKLTEGQTLGVQAASLIGIFCAPETGRYYVQMTSDDRYNLLVTRNATFDSHPKHNLDVVQDITATGNVLGHWSSIDRFSFVAKAGDILTIETHDLIQSGHGQADPMIRLLGPDRKTIAEDLDGAADGRNARLTYTVEAGGKYYLHVRTTDGMAPYLLTVSGYTALPSMLTARTDRFLLEQNSPQSQLTPLANDLHSEDVWHWAGIEQTSQVSHGELTISEDGQSVLYEPDAGYTGMDEFTYTVRNQDGMTDTAVVTIHVAPPNGPNLVAFANEKQASGYDDWHLRHPGMDLPDILVPGDKMRIPILLANAGDQAIDGPVEVVLYASQDEIFDGQDPELARLTIKRLRLAPNESKSVKVSFVLPSTVYNGDYYLVAQADAQGQLTESNEIDNAVVGGPQHTVAWVFGSNILGRKKTKLVTVDLAGTPVTYSLKGSGLGGVEVDEFGVHHVGLFYTDAKSSLKIQTKGKNVTTAVAEIYMDTHFGSVDARTTDLLGSVLAKGVLGKLRLAKALPGSIVDIRGRNQPTTMEFAEIWGLSIQTRGRIESLKLIEWLVNPEQEPQAAPDIQADSIGKLTVTGKKANPRKGIKGSDGHFEANMSLIENLGKTKIAGIVANASWNIGLNMGDLTAMLGAFNSTIRTGGSMGKIVLGATSGSDFLAGCRNEVTRHAQSADDFASEQTIKSVKIKGVKDQFVDPTRRYYIDSNFSAASIGKVSLMNVDFDNDNTTFGLFALDEAESGIKSITYRDTETKDKWKWPFKQMEVRSYPDLMIRLL